MSDKSLHATASAILRDLLEDVTWPQALAGLAAAILLFILTNTILSYRRLAHIKGPRLASWTPLWLFSHTCQGDVYSACAALLKQHASLVRIAPNNIVTDDPEIMRLMTSPKAPWKRGHWFEGLKLDPAADNVMSTRDVKAHADLRKRLVPGYSGHDVPTLELDIDDRIVELKQLLQDKFVDKQKFDFAMVAHFFTLDILTKIAFGEPLGFLTKNEDLFNFIKNSNDFFPVMELASNHPTVLSIMRTWPLSAMQPKPTDKEGFGAILGHARNIVNARLEPGAEKQADMLGSLINHGLDRTRLQSETVLLLLAGSDSTATSLRHIMLHLASTPRVYAKLRAEIDEAVVNDKVSSPVITNSEAAALPYLRAVVMEGLRIFMPLVGLTGHQAPRGGATINDVYIPGGTEVSVSTYSMLRRPDLFGEDADTFRPERWIEGDEQAIKSMERNHSLVFGSGHTTCLGKNVALIELRKTVFELMRSFDMVLVNPMRPITIRANGVIAEKDMWMRAYSRS